MACGPTYTESEEVNKGAETHLMSVDSCISLFVSVHICMCVCICPYGVCRCVNMCDKSIYTDHLKGLVTTQLGEEKKRKLNKQNQTK